MGRIPASNRSDWGHNFIDKTGAQQALLRDLGINIFRTQLPSICRDGDGNLIEDKMQEVLDLVNVCEDYGQKDYIINEGALRLRGGAHRPANPRQE